jgi:hypothetical protein
MVLFPLKFRILEILSDGNAHWNSDIVHAIQNEYGLHSTYGRDTINFDIIELASNGLLRSIESKVDEDGSYKKGYMLNKYVLTDIGKSRAVYAGVYKGGTDNAP